MTTPMAMQNDIGALVPPTTIHHPAPVGFHLLSRVELVLKSMMPIEMLEFTSEGEED